MYNIPPVNHETFELITQHLISGDKIWLQLVCDGELFDLHFSLDIPEPTFDDLLQRAINGDRSEGLSEISTSALFVHDNFGEEYSKTVYQNSDINKEIRNICFAVAKVYTQVDINGATTE